MPDHISLGIDASNIRAGGGVTHLSCLLGKVQSVSSKINRITVFGSKRTIDRLPSGKRIQLVPVPLLNGPLPVRLAWQRWILPACLRSSKCDVLLSPGGILPARTPFPTIVMSQNLLPFEPQESGRFSTFSFMRLKLRLVGSQQRSSMMRADGLVFLTKYARDRVLGSLPQHTDQITIIPHGVDPRFHCTKLTSKPVEVFSRERPFRLLYVSIVDVYKHQWQVAKAVASMRCKGMPIEIDFVGPAYAPALRLLKTAIKHYDPQGEFLNYRGSIPFEELHSAYHEADAFVFASSCENLPNILLEAMASGLPIACSDRGPMPEVLGDAGIYFNPEQPEDIETALTALLENPELRHQLSNRSYSAGVSFSWDRCAEATFSFIVRVVSSKRSGLLL